MKRDKYCMVSLIHGILKTEQNKTKHLRDRDQTCSCQMWRVAGAGTGGRWSKGINFYL